MPSKSPSSSELGRHIVALLNDCPDIYGAVVATIDGYPLATLGRNDALPEKQLAAMSSTLVSLGDSVAELLGQGICKNILVENDEGTVLVLHAGPEPLHLSRLGEGGFDGTVVVIRPE